jgi:hypothetical protein
LEQSLLKKEKIICPAQHFRIKRLKNMRQDMVAANAKQAFRAKVKFPCELPTNIAIFNLARIYGQVFKLFCKIEKFLQPNYFSRSSSHAGIIPRYARLGIGTAVVFLYLLFRMIHYLKMIR